MTITAAPIVYSVFKHKIGGSQGLDIDKANEWIIRNHERFSEGTSQLNPRPVYHSEIVLDPINTREVVGKLLSKGIQPIISGITNQSKLRIAIDTGARTGISPHIEKDLLKAAQEKGFNLIPEGCNVKDFNLLEEIVNELKYKLYEVKVMPFRGDYFSPQDLGNLLKALYPKESSERNFVNDIIEGTVSSPTDFIAAFMTGRNPIHLKSLEGVREYSSIRSLKSINLSNQENRFISANGGVTLDDIIPLHNLGVRGFGLSEPFKVTSLDAITSNNWEEADRKLDLLTKKICSLYIL